MRSGEDRAGDRVVRQGHRHGRWPTLAVAVGLNAQIVGAELEAIDDASQRAGGAGQHAETTALVDAVNPDFHLVQRNGPRHFDVQARIAAGDLVRGAGDHPHGEFVASRVVIGLG